METSNRPGVKQYKVIWRKIGEEVGTVVCLTNDLKKAYEYARNKLPNEKEALVYNGDVLEYQGIKA